MKVAGRKNDGAWFRTNKMLSKITDAETQALVAILEHQPESQPAYDALIALATETGTLPIPHAANLDDWFNTLCSDGIPRELWYGRLSWTVYQKDSSGKYTPKYAAPIRNFGKMLRKQTTKFAMARRTVRDVFNSGGLRSGNPGGLPNADKTS